MSITGYASRFGPVRLAGIIAEQAFNVAGFLLNSGKPLDDDLRRIAADVAEIRKLLTSAAPVASFPARTEDAAETPPAGHGTRRGQPRVASDVYCPHCGGRGYDSHGEQAYMHGRDCDANGPIPYEQALSLERATRIFRVEDIPDEYWDSTPAPGLAEQVLKNLLLGLK